MDPESNDLRLTRIERRLNVLIGVMLIQSALLTVMSLGYFLPSTFTLIVFCLLLAAFFWFFRQQIPGWFGGLSRFVFEQLRDSEDTDPKKWS